MRLLGKPDGRLCEAEKVKDEGAPNPAAGAGAGGIDGVAELAKGDQPKADVAVPWSPIFEMIGADVDAPKGENEELVSADGIATFPEVAGTEEVEPKTEGDVPKAGEALPNAEPLRFPKTFGVVLIFAKAEAAGGTECVAGGMVDPDARLEDPKADVGGIPKAEVDELVPTMTEGEGRTPKLFVSHSVGLGFNGCGWC
jgi:hypothetical protein